VALRRDERQLLKPSTASGFQIAFLAFAVALLAAPLADFIAARAGLSAAETQLVSRIFIFAVPVIAALASGPLRRECLELLRCPIHREHRGEVAAAAVLQIATSFASAGTVAAWHWWQGGADEVAQHIFVRKDVQLVLAFSWVGIAMIPIAGLVAPLVEEIVFRGFMLRAWARRWGWFTGMLLTALAFGLFHPYAAGAFVSSVIFACVFRRTGSLWSAIVIHGAGNILLWYPFAGRFVFPSEEAVNLASLSVWWPNIAALLAVVVGVPVYVWMSREDPGSRSLLAAARAA
jgi:membrane protease YdiL (CAAX protease family)